MKHIIFILLGVLLLKAAPVGAQTVVLSEADYAAAKLNGTLPAGAIPEAGDPPPFSTPPLAGEERGGGTNDCNCWIQPDATYTLAMQPNDDGSSTSITLPFSFNLYGDTYNTCFINNNGNVSFVQAFGTYTSSGFPSTQYKMVAPFWADVDTRPANGGQVWYKVTPTALYVNWVDVGYFNQMTDKLNSFQLVITDGTDPVIGVDKNVSFCYKDMQWTTGSASGGIGGFGGTAATVGANRGSNNDYIQFGRFDHAGTDYDGPFGNTDGVSWLDFKNFVFTTITSTTNIPPIAAGLYLCDTLRACVGQTAELELTFLSPESNQTTVASSSAPTLSNWVEIANTSGIVASVTGQFTPTVGDIGFHQVIYIGTDDGTPNLTSTIPIVIEVIPPPSDPPGIQGNAAICSGQTVTLTATGPFSSFTWSNGQSGPSITVNQAGTYSVTAGIGLCQLTSDPFTVTLVVPPALTITGPSTYCGTPLPELVASTGYESYAWSNGASGDTAQVTGGTFTVSGTYQGCVNVSAPFTVNNIDPGPPVIAGPTQYCEGGDVTLSINATPYGSYQWSTGVSTPNITATAGTYTVTASFLNCDYTSAPFTVQEIILPPVSITGNALYCENGIATISATPGFETYSWNNNSFGQTINVTAGSYFVSASIGPCTTFSNTFNVAVSPNPVPVITGPDFSCGGDQVDLTTTEPFANYAWSNGSNGASTTVGTGSYTVTVTDALGCNGTSAPYGVVVANDPFAAFNTTPLSPQPIGTTVDFTDASTVQGTTITGWAWTFNTTGGGSNDPSPEWTFTSPGDYAVTLIVTTAQGCVDSVQTIYVIFPPDITIPNVISPNGDHQNDYFVIPNIEFWSNELSIFNRWGNLVYDVKNYRNQWKADDLPDGTYYYVLKLNDGTEHTGHLTVLR
ncbi:MAG: gliding motility-associated C-terminal domain-containing protein [Flavobacteriales bacterium]|nr:gliding motility-associated C-terminal domain-containing protein [Flavobacteriales bacterium]MCC6939043.1 gliding motility-associated C-terminal domain-containing protein [Flavobacteriales bacterium]